MATTQAERIARLETEVSILREELKDANRKLDDLLALKAKGAGAFWLMSILFGAGFAAILSWLPNLWRN